MGATPTMPISCQEKLATLTKSLVEIGASSTCEVPTLVYCYPYCCKMTGTRINICRLTFVMHDIPYWEFRD